MKVTYKITNQELFDSKISDLDTSGLKSRGKDSHNNHFGFYGHLQIEEEAAKGFYPVSGDFGKNDYKEQFGFILSIEKE